MRSTRNRRRGKIGIASVRRHTARFLPDDHPFGVTRGEQPLVRCGERGVQRSVSTGSGWCTDRQAKGVDGEAQSAGNTLCISEHLRNASCPLQPPGCVPDWAGAYTKRGGSRNTPLTLWPSGASRPQRPVQKQWNEKTQGLAVRWLALSVACGDTSPRGGGKGVSASQCVFTNLQRDGENEAVPGMPPAGAPSQSEKPLAFGRKSDLMEAES